MNKNEYIEAGQITKPIGLKGLMQLKLNTDFRRLYNRIDTLFVEVAGNPVPHFVIKITPKGNDMVLLEMEDIETEADARQLTNAKVYVTVDIMPTLGTLEFYHHEVMGFTVVDTEKGELGPVVEILDIPQQSVVAVSYKSKEVLIPLAGHILKGIDRAAKTITVTCPEGLIELYLGNPAAEIPDDGEEDGSVE
ncbi:MAG: ribosome maturation factor RimM [Sphingobacteriales bacterium JAD_PAG50586_3]|nr:MAG: ribosome maturation factor RimM [Sphingobacteriales bacterium JAD_PAG50586_3]